MTTPTSTPLTTLIKEMREASEKATPGPWDWSNQLGVYSKDVTIASEVKFKDAAHIALCNPENIRRVLDALDEMLGAAKYLEKMRRTGDVYQAQKGILRLQAAIAKAEE